MKGWEAHVLSRDSLELTLPDEIILNSIYVPMLGRKRVTCKVEKDKKLRTRLRMMRSLFFFGGPAAKNRLNTVLSPTCEFSICIDDGWQGCRLMRGQYVTPHVNWGSNATVMPTL